MKGKIVAVTLAALMIFSVGSSVSARHLAEEYADRVQRERREHMEEEARYARRQAQAEARRQATEERDRRLQEEEQWSGFEDEYDEEPFDEEAVGDGRSVHEAEEVPATEKETVINKAEQDKDKSKTETEAYERERLAVESQEREASERQREQEETERREVGQAVQEQKQQAKEQNLDLLKEANPTGESFLQQLLRRAKERVEGIQASVAEQPTLHVSKPQPMKILQSESVDTGGTLIFSDSPEYIKKTGILYTDTVKGDARVFYYHLNDMGKKCKVAVVLENVGGQYAIVRVTRRAIAAPSNNYSQVGKGVQQTYFAGGQETEKIYVAAGERRLLADGADKIVLAPGELVSGMIDFTVSAPVRVSVLCYPAGKNPLTYIDEAEILPPDEHRMRGTFVGMDRIVRLERYNPDDEGVACVMLGDGEYDKFCEGVDATDGSLATNYGNYGVLYRIEASTRGKTKFFLSPMGGYFAGAVRVEAGTSGTKLVNVPSGRLNYGANSVHPPFSKEGMTTLLPTVELSEIGSYNAKPPVFFEFSPPGASNLPVLFILAPDDLKLENNSAS